MIDSWPHFHAANLGRFRLAGVRGVRVSHLVEDVLLESDQHADCSRMAVRIVVLIERGDRLEVRLAGGDCALLRPAGIRHGLQPNGRNR